MTEPAGPVRQHDDPDVPRCAGITSFAPTLGGASIDRAVARLRPDHRARLVTVTGVPAGPSDDASDAALRRAEQAARGDEPFDTIADGDPVTLTAEVGEVIWRDDAGATCRRWNWRQCVRTRLEETTHNVLFILDALEPTSTDALHAAGAALAETVTAGSDSSDVAMRLLPTVT